MSRYFDLTDSQASDLRDDFPAEVLFATASSAVILADDTTGIVVAINPAALGLLGARRAAVQGLDWREVFAQPCAQPLQAAVAKAKTSGCATQATVYSRTRAAALTATVSRFYSSNHPYLLIRVASGCGDTPVSSPSDSVVLDQLDALSSGFVLTDGELRLEFWNRAFLELVGEQPGRAFEGISLLRWLNLMPADLDRMRDQMARHEATTFALTTLCAQSAFPTSVEFTAVAVPDAACPHWGFILRKAGSRRAKVRKPTPGA
jgi:PAS domain-containing protein